MDEARTARVTLIRTSPVTLADDVRQLVEADLRGRFDPARKTLIKVNGNHDRYYPGSNTSPWFLDAMLSVLCDMGFRDLAAVEGDLPLFRARDMFRRTRMLPVCEAHGVPCVPHENFPRDRHEIPEFLRDAQLINTPLFHGHGFATISVATKNLFGVLPVYRRRYHLVLSEKLLELVVQLPCYTITDGTVGLDGESTRRGNPLRMDLLMSGWDVLALDCVAARVLGHEPLDIPVLRLAADRGMVNPGTITLGGDFSWDDLPSFPMPLRLSPGRKAVMFLESTGLRHSRTFLWIEDRMARTFHNITYVTKLPKLLRGDWMEYARAFENHRQGSGRSEQIR